MKTRFLFLALAVMAGPAVAQKGAKPAPESVPSSIDGLPIGAIPRQQLPDQGCAVYLWSAGTTHALVAIVSADPAQLRFSLDGTVADYPRVAQNGTGGYGFSGLTTYQSGTTKVTLDMTIETQDSIADGALVPRATLRLDRPGKDTVILPVGGMIGCAAAPATPGG